MELGGQKCISFRAFYAFHSLLYYGFCNIVNVCMAVLENQSHALIDASVSVCTPAQEQLLSWVAAAILLL